MTTLYFIRHGKTEWNEEGRFQGASGDSPLLAESLQQISVLGQYLADINFDHAFSSPIKRAKTTAELTLKNLKHIPELTELTGLKEFTMGVWEGMTFDDVKAKWPRMYDAYRHHPERFEATQVIGSETFEQVQARFTAAIQMAIEQYGGPDRTLIFFSHGMALTAGMGALLGIPLDQIRARGGLGNTSTSILTTDDGINFKEVIRNDTSYLGVESDASNTI
ncbi:histidine phosphatase family protein [Weissella muntiaci]|uniref:Histidine phosphatase family protein n=1 Tax=Weissella muntiaci TaxID=2508881 RepID=A0A6C2C7W5_9LACO|nr:histidine phosphatase family protein [Weissella muntiaci]TYC50120.1 histidine phosphatase family protein [Weissella muntiaci]